MPTDQQLPDDIHAALLRSAKAWLLSNYVGGRKKLEAWSEHYAWLTSINSSSLKGQPGTNLRRLSRLAAAGVLVEHPRYRSGIGPRRFTAPQPLLDNLWAQRAAAPIQRTLF